MKLMQKYAFLLNVTKSLPFLKDYLRNKHIPRFTKWLSLLILIGYPVAPDFMPIVIDDVTVAAFMLDAMRKQVEKHTPVIETEADKPSGKKQLA